MLQAPSGDFTVSDVFTLNNFGEIDLASGTTPLRQPTDVARPRSAAAQAVADDNAARAVTLDDGSSTNYLSAANAGQPLPWITRDTPVRVGAGHALHEAGGPRLPQRPLEVPADQPAHPGQRLHGAAGHVPEHPHRGAGSTSTAT
jgi:hypothetical protein